MICTYVGKVLDTGLYCHMGNCILEGGATENMMNAAPADIEACSLESEWSSHSCMQPRQ